MSVCENGLCPHCLLLSTLFLSLSHLVRQHQVVPLHPPIQHPVDAVQLVRVQGQPTSGAAPQEGRRLAKPPPAGARGRGSLHRQLAHAVRNGDARHQRVQGARAAWRG